MKCPQDTDGAEDFQMWRAGASVLNKQPYVQIRFIGNTGGFNGQGSHWTNGGLYVLCFWKGNENHHLWAGFLVHQRIISEVKRVELLSDRMYV
jgi:hypothetical protein